jgi:hypothetical protein
MPTSTIFRLLIRKESMRREVIFFNSVYLILGQVCPTSNHCGAFFYQTPGGIINIYFLECTDIIFVLLLSDVRSTSNG